MRLAALLIALASPTLAEAPRLALPLDCTLGQTCFIEDYVDQDPAHGRQRDYTCGINARDAHRGTDFAIMSFEDDVSVLASAAGQVARVRDTMPDDRHMHGVTSDTACGNAVLINHAGGWQTLYCHLRLGSVTVSPGDLVQAGDTLGQIGLSGRTNHPHVHFTVFKDGALIDPFRPNAPQGTCGDTGETLWDSPILYYATGLVTAGFSDSIPTLDDVRSGAARRNATPRDTSLVVYAHIGYGQPGDMLTLWATDPTGQEIFRQDILLDSAQRSQMRAFGRKAPAEGWAQGDYTGRALLTRNGTVMAHRFAHITVGP